MLFIINHNKSLIYRILLPKNTKTRTTGRNIIKTISHILYTGLFKIFEKKSIIILILNR